MKVNNGFVRCVDCKYMFGTINMECRKNPMVFTSQTSHGYWPVVGYPNSDGCYAGKNKKDKKVV